MTTTAYVLFGLGVLWLLYLASVTIDKVRRLSAQLAVLTMRVAELGEVLDALDVRLRTVRKDHDKGRMN